MTAAIIIQARMGSSRLRGKTLEPLGDATVLDWVVDRAGMAIGSRDVIVATSTEPEDDAIADHLERRGRVCVRGSADDVLARYGAAMAETSADVIVRVTADCPFVDPGIIDRAIEGIAAGSGDVDYVSTSLDGRYPRGLDVEAMRREVLAAAVAEARDADEREHVTLFIYRRPERFRCEPVEAPEWARREDLRITIDESADLELARVVVDTIGQSASNLSAEYVLQFLGEHPAIAAINRDVAHRNIR